MRFALSFECCAHPRFALAAVIFPAVVKERDAAVYGFVNDTLSFGFVGCVPEVVAAESQSRDAYLRFAEFARRYVVSLLHEVGAPRSTQSSHR